MSNEAWQMRDARRAARREAKAASTLRAAGPQAIDVHVLDLSETGIRIAADVALEVGQEISIGLAGVGARRAYVAWARGTEYGCAFGTALAPEEAAKAFATASVIAIGGPAAPSGGAIDNAQLKALYADHRTWALPLDAVVVGAAFLILFGIAFWDLVRP